MSTEEFKEFASGLEKIPRDKINARLSSSGGRSSKYAKIKDLARKKLEPGGEGFWRKGVTEDVVSAVRTQVYHLNDDNLGEHQEAKYDVTRRKMTDEDGDVTNKDGEQLYEVCIKQEPKKEKPAGEQQDQQEQESDAVPENGESKQQDVASEKEEDWDEMWD